MRLSEIFYFILNYYCSSGECLRQQGASSHTIVGIECVRVYIKSRTSQEDARKGRAGVSVISSY